jgi:hypothetical protein
MRELAWMPARGGHTMKNGSRMVLVVKRGGGTEPFSPEKLRRCFWRALGGETDLFQSAECLSQAVGIYLKRENRWRISSRALLEIAIRALRQTGHDQAAKDLELHHRDRLGARRQLKVTQAAQPGESNSTNTWTFRWDRDWVTRQIEQRWQVSRTAAAVISADIEEELLSTQTQIDRQALLDLIDERVDHFGLAPWCLLASMPAQ